MAEWGAGPATIWAPDGLQLGGDKKALGRGGEDPALAVPLPCVTLGEFCPFINLNDHPNLPHGAWEKRDMNVPNQRKVKRTLVH